MVKRKQTVFKKHDRANLDSIETTLIHSIHIRNKRFLRDIYYDNYSFFKEELNDVPQGTVVELGSGGGFLKEVIPQVFTSDIVPLPDIDLVFSGLNLPFKDSSLSGILLQNVFHHFQNVELFFYESLRCLKEEGKIIMVEPAATPFSRFIYKYFHYEGFDMTQKDWLLPQGGRMSSSNNALPWIVFVRDRNLFEEKFPALKIKLIKPFMPFRYILSGGVSRRQFLPDFCSPLVKAFEKILSPLNPYLGLSLQIVLKKEET